MTDTPNVEGIERLELIGHGGFATVYRGFQPAFRRDVAVKILLRSGLDADDRRRFERECHAMGMLSNHPGIVTLFDAGFTAEGRPYLVMAYVADGSLHDWLTNVGPINWEQGTVLGVRLAGALETAHRAGVLHRDVKPANVLRSEYGAQLTDFGIARLHGGTETRSGVITASFAHAAPEVFDGDPPTPQADIYSLGSTLYEGVTGRPAYVRDTDHGLLPLIRRVATEPLPDLRERGIPDPLAAVIETSMAKDPNDRFRTAEDFGLALQDAQATLGIRVTDLAIVADRSGGVGGGEDGGEDRGRDEPSTPPGDVGPATIPSGAGVTIDIHSGDLADAELVEAETPPADGADVPPPPGEDRRWKPKALAAVVGAAGAIALLVGVLALWPDSDSAQEAAPPTAVVTVPDPSAPPGTGTPTSEPTLTAAPTVATTVPGTSLPTTTTRDEAATTTVAVAPSVPPPSELEVIAVADVATDTDVGGFTLTAIDGIAFDPARSQLLAVREPAPADVGATSPGLADPVGIILPILWEPDNEGQKLVIDLTAGIGAPLRHADGSPYGRELDIEGTTIEEDGSFFVVSEGGGEGGGDDAFVHRFDATGAFQSELVLPAWYTPNTDRTEGIAPGLGLHGIASRPGTPGEVIVGIEGPLAQDDDPTDPSEQRVARFLAFDIATLAATAEWGYPLGPVPSASAGADGQVIDLATLADGSLVVLERIQTDSGPRTVLFQVHLGDGAAPTPALPPAVEKQQMQVFGDGGSELLAPFESIAAGPRLPDGRESIVLVSDNVFSQQPTRIMVVAVNPGR